MTEEGVDLEQGRILVGGEGLADERVIQHELAPQFIERYRLDVAVP